MPYLFLMMLVIITGFSKSVASQECINKTNVSEPINYKKKKNIIISGLEISSDSTACISLYKCKNITIENCILGPSGGEGIKLEKCKNIKIINCAFANNIAGVLAKESKEIKVNHNQFLNVQYRVSQRQFVQFDKVSGKGNEIISNTGENEYGKSDPEDLINIYKSTGTKESPILIKGNKLRGGGPSESGGGILAGDNGGRYIVIEENILVDPGQYGIAIAGGRDIQVINNKVYGRQQAFTNVGIYVWNQNSTDCNSHRVEGNEVTFINSKGTLNPAWNSGNCSLVEGWENNNWNASLTSGILPKELICKELFRMASMEKKP
jgi:nitrous oxidase accessory protein NosD